MKIKTEILQRLVEKAVKGCSFNPNVLLTGILSITTRDNKLFITSTDMSNYVSAYTDVENVDDINITVPADVFSKLVGRTTSEYIDLTLSDGTLIVKGNGRYSIELPLDENGSIFTFSNKGIDNIGKTANSCEMSLFKLIQHSLKPALLPVTRDTASSCYINYYCGDSVIATDSEVVSSLSVKLFDEPILLSSQLVDLICLSDASKVSFVREDNNITFITGDLAIYSVIPENIDIYDKDRTQQLLDIPFGYSCTINKSQLLSAFDRLSLFMDERLDMNVVKAEFTDSELILSTLDGNSTESVAYSNSIDCKSFACNIGIRTFIPQLKAYSEDAVKIQFGSEDNDVIKLLDNGVQQLIALAL